MRKVYCHYQSTDGETEAYGAQGSSLRLQSCHAAEGDAGGFLIPRPLLVVECKWGARRALQREHMRLRTGRGVQKSN